MEPGTLYQLRNLIHCRNVKPNPKEDVNYSENFVEVITIGHVLSAVMKFSTFDEDRQNMFYLQTSGWKMIQFENRC